MNPSHENLFPPITPFREGLLALDGSHQMHWQLSGNPDGDPVLWIHGGPGSSASPMHRRLFDPKRYLIIQYDQRGCGRSQPRGETRCNTTQDLLADIEQLRLSLGIARWHVAGGSWGGSLALLYAQLHPAVIGRMLLRSPFLCSDREIDAYVNSPVPACKEVWTQLREQCNQEGSADILAHSHRIFSAPLEETARSADRLRLARAWAAYEAAMDGYPAAHRVCSTPTTSTTPTPPSSSDEQALIARYRVHLHYLWHRCFVERPILTRPERFNAIELTLVHGEQDALCPFDNSLTIKRLVPHARLVAVPGAGHNAFGEGMVRSVVDQIQRWT